MLRYKRKGPNLYLISVLLHQEVQLEVMKVVQVQSTVVVYKKQGFVDKLLENVFHFLWLQIPQNTQYLQEKKDESFMFFLLLFLI